MTEMRNMDGMENDGDLSVAFADELAGTGLMSSVPESRMLARLYENLWQEKKRIVNKESAL